MQLSLSIMAMTFDLSKLNESETAALRMLADGHTIKSIAASLETSEGAVNERLRAARRKTGIGSSRELARLFASQENCDRIPVIAGEGMGESNSIQPESGVQSRRWLIGGTAMFIATGLAFASYIGLAGASVETNTKTSVKIELQNGPVPPKEAEIAKLMEQSRPRQGNLYQKVRAEKRDAAWAEPVEKQLIERYGTAFGSLGESLAMSLRFNILCGRTLCEVYAKFAQPQDEQTVDALYQALRFKPRVGEHPNIQMVEMSIFGPELEMNGETRLVTYWQAMDRK